VLGARLNGSARNPENNNNGKLDAEQNQAQAQPLEATVTGANDFMKTNPHTKLEGQRLLPAAPFHEKAVKLFFSGTSFYCNYSGRLHGEVTGQNS
jgi:hypothetical protein